MEKMNLGVVGLGWWGTKLLRNFQNHPMVNKIYGYDTSNEAINKILSQGGNFQPVRNYEDLLGDRTSSIAIATPPQTHFQLAKMALKSGKNVLVTKPPSETSAEVETLTQLAAEKKLVFMVDATYIFNPALEAAFSRLQKNGKGGLKSIRILRFGDDLRMHHIDRLKKTMFQNNIDIIKDLIFHDISILAYFLSKELKIEAIRKFNTLHDNLSDSAFIFIRANNIPGILEYSWTFPERRREFQFYYRDKFLMCDDLSADEKVWEFTYEDKKRVSFNHDKSEPLFCEVDHFLDCIKQGIEPKTGSSLMKNITKIMEKIDTLMEQEK